MCGARVPTRPSHFLLHLGDLGRNQILSSSLVNVYRVGPIGHGHGLILIASPAASGRKHDSIGLTSPVFPYRGPI